MFIFCTFFLNKVFLLLESSVERLLVFSMITRRSQIMSVLNCADISSRTLIRTSSIFIWADLFMFSVEFEVYESVITLPVQHNGGHQS